MHKNINHLELIYPFDTYIQDVKGRNNELDEEMERLSQELRKELESKGEQLRLEYDKAQDTLYDLLDSGKISEEEFERLYDELEVSTDNLFVDAEDEWDQKTDELRSIDHPFIKEFYKQTVLNFLRYDQEFQDISERDIETCMEDWENTFCSVFDLY